MFQLLREFQVGRPQIFAGIMLAVFFGQCLWTSESRPMSELEYRYMLSGLLRQTGPGGAASPFTSLVASAPTRFTELLRKIGPGSWSASLAVPRRWLLRLPFAVFGIWLGAALWWVARRLFDDEGGYVALALYCSSPAIIKISSNAGPEIILAWSILGLIYTAIGVAHTLYAPPRKWVPRIAILGLSIGFALATAWWSFTLVLLAAAYMFYLAPDCRGKVLLVLSGACALGLAVLLTVRWLGGNAGLPWHALFQPRPAPSAITHLAFPLSAATDGYALVGFFIAALTTYGSWSRARYFGNTAPLATAMVCVLLFALAPGLRLWDASLGLSFVFLFIGGVAADLLETRIRRILVLTLGAGFLLRGVLTLMELRHWAQNLM